MAVATALLLSSCGDVADAKGVFEEDAESVRFVRGLREGLAQRRSPTDQEIRHLKELAQLYPEDVYVEQTMMAVLVPIKDWEGLATYFETRDELGDEQRFQLARVYINQANYTRARDTITELAEANPLNVEANLLAGRAHYFLGENDAAAKFYDRVWQGITDQGLVSEVANRAMIHLDAGHLDQAQAMLETALATTTDSVALHSAMARVLGARGDVAGARQHSSRVTELQQAAADSDHHAMLRAAQTIALNEAWGEGDFDKCLRLINSFLPGAEPSFQEELLRFLAKMYEAAGRGAEVPAAVERAREYARKKKDA